MADRDSKSTQIIFCVGPTASGKSSASLRWAQEHKLNIVNADSIQIYKGLNIGSAKPLEAEKALAPHFLWDIFEPGEKASLGDYHRKFLEIHKSFIAKSENYVVVGGTGFYFQAIEKGIPKIPAANREFQDDLFKRLSNEPYLENELHQKLTALDPEAAARIHVNDHYRLVRALDVIQTTGQSLKQSFESRLENGLIPKHKILKIGFMPDREKLRVRVRARILEMLKNGILEEVQELIDGNLADWEPLQSVGYAQCREFLLKAKTDHEELIQLITRETMRLAKKQRTWFQRDSEIHWFQDSDDPQADILVKNWIQ